MEYYIWNSLALPPTLTGKSHQNPEGSYEKLFTHLAAIALEKLDPVERQKRREHREHKRNQAGVKTTLEDSNDKASLPTLETKRSIPKPLRDQVWLRDGGQCQIRKPPRGLPYLYPAIPISAQGKGIDLLKKSKRGFEDVGEKGQSKQIFRRKNIIFFICG